MPGNWGAAPGHGQKLNIKDRAWRWMTGGMEAAQIDTSSMQSQHYRIPFNQSGVGRAVDIIVVKMPPTETIAEDRYFGIECERLSDTPERADFSKVDKRSGKVLWVEYKDVASGQIRTGLVWLR